MGGGGRGRLDERGGAGGVAQPSAVCSCVGVTCSWQGRGRVTRRTLHLQESPRCPKYRFKTSLVKNRDQQMSSLQTRVYDPETSRPCLPRWRPM